jgi:hypothetical protein
MFLRVDIVQVKEEEVVFESRRQIVELIRFYTLIPLERVVVVGADPADDINVSGLESNHCGVRRRDDQKRNFVKVGKTIPGCVLVQSWPFTVRRLTPRIRCLVEVDAAVTQLRRDVLGVCHGLRRRALIQIRVYATKQRHRAGHEGRTERSTPPRGVSSERISRDDTFSWGLPPKPEVGRSLKTKRPGKIVSLLVVDALPITFFSPAG